MMTLDEITKKVLEQIDASGFKQSGAFNLRHNGIALCHGDSEHIKIKKKQDKPGIDIYIDGKTDGEEVHIPVVVDATGMTDVVYNDFYIEEGANVTIVAGCGIHNSGCNESRHDGIHTFHVEKTATYVMWRNITEKAKEQEQESSTRSQKFILARIPYLHLIPHR